MIVVILEVFQYIAFKNNFIIVTEKAQKYP